MVVIRAEEQFSSVEVGQLIQFLSYINWPNSSCQLMLSTTVLFPDSVHVVPSSGWAVFKIRMYFVRIKFCNWLAAETGNDSRGPRLGARPGRDNAVCKSTHKAPGV